MVLTVNPALVAHCDPSKPNIAAFWTFPVPTRLVSTYVCQDILQMDLRRVCKLLLTSVSPCQQAPRNKMAVLAELSQFTWFGVSPDDAWERPRIQVKNIARGRRSSATRASLGTLGRTGKTTPIHVHHAFLYISLPSLHDYDGKMANVTFYGGRKQATAEFSFSFYS